ncbi:ADP-ribosyl-[dinitrogen reductase] glycohydrolase [Corynebacterium atrinae]|uniref:ADP-ribosylglycohydrolase family protein n=1 Tax=Corynebacterium atrinae TaxID=1336740 RepID=UPI0025B55708|nr:ADP-ribosylglycohydrolase family protein [Corynebacterium atrinae]WJY63610.1 ADP-ribosyl-[dinitrogen reductase] glycohydrolase [Corynebacterium atrinae]
MTFCDADLLRDRARGCLLGQFIGDSLGSLVEFQSAARIAQLHPDGVRDLADGGTWDLIAGQPTDDSQMAMMLIRSLQRRDTFDVEDVFASYVHWYSTGPFDIGGTCAAALSGGPVNANSQANGALMRVSPLGVFGVRSEVGLATAVEFARADARLTHPHPVCVDANAAFVAALTTGIRGGDPEQMIAAMEATATNESVLEAIAAGRAGDVSAYEIHEGWVLLALSIAVRQLMLFDDPESALIDAVGMGGDTDTNAAIAGALLGAAHGNSGWPRRWVDTVLECRPGEGIPSVRHPLGREFWATDLVMQADELAGLMSERS